MTTILADARLGVMVCDSQWSDGVQKGITRKVFRICGDLVGCAGNLDEREQFLDWYRSGCVGKFPKGSSLSVLVLKQDGLFHCVGNEVLMPVDGGIHAVGTGGVPAMCAYEALGWDNPKRAVEIVCHHDAKSNGPVRVHRLKGSRR